MQVTKNLFTVSDLVEWLGEKNLIINNDYQRGGGLWPLNARSYFIDTVLNGYPFPKVTIRQTIDLKTKKTVREIIDGQQRIMTLYDFINNDLTLSSVSKYYTGKKFKDLESEEQQRLLMYEVSVDTILAATEEEVLEIFRRMNSYTLPLNDQEKRHATYQGEFKWFIKDMIDLYSPVLEKYNILSLKQISRMIDADLMTELCQVIMYGILARSKNRLEEIYKSNDKIFKSKQTVKQKLEETLKFMKVNLNPVLERRVLKGYSFYSLFSALIYNKFGISNVSNIGGMVPSGDYTSNINKAIQNILELHMSVELNDDEGINGEFVKACNSTTHSLNNRMIRLQYYVSALQDL